VKKRPKLRLVGKGEGEDGSGYDGASVFDNLDQLRADMASADAMRPVTGPGSSGKQPLSLRRRETETFARIPHDRALKLHHRLSGSAWVALIELDRMILAGRGGNPVLFWSPRLRAAGLTGRSRARVLRQLEAAGVVEVEWRRRGLAPLVRHLWFPRQD
jgi:hypothetical protein